MLLGDLKEAFILLVFATMSVVITAVQETRTERVLEALRDLTSPRALVIRDGERKRIAGREVVRGDFVVLSEGDRVPADAALMRGQDLQTDESLLTGESVPVRKIACAPMRRSRPPAGGRRSALCVFRLAGRARNRNRRSDRDRCAERNRQDWPIAQHSWRRSRRVCGRRRGSWCGCLLVAGGGVSVLAVLLYGLCAEDGSMRCSRASRSACRCCRKSFPSCSPFHGDGRMADFAGPRADASRRGHRDSGFGHGFVHG